MAGVSEIAEEILALKQSTCTPPRFSRKCSRRSWLRRADTTLSGPDPEAVLLVGL